MQSVCQSWLRRAPIPHCFAHVLQYGLTDEEAAQQLVMNVVKLAPSFTLEVVVEASNLLADKAEQVRQ